MKNKNEEIKLYTKVKRFDNMEESQKELFDSSTFFKYSEKIDGSNVCILKWEGNLYPFSRKRLITDKGNMPGLFEFIEKHKDIIQNFLKDGEVICGEFLGQGKIGYNKIAKQGIIPSYYIFNYCVLDNSSSHPVLKTNIEMNEKIDNLVECSDELRRVPSISNSYKFLGVKPIYDNFVRNRKSYLDPNHNDLMEGCVANCLSEELRPLCEIKIVSKDFEEYKKDSNNKKKSGLDVMYDYLTNARLEKFFTNICVEPNVENLSKICENINQLTFDIIEEEPKVRDAILKELNSRSVRAVKEFIKNKNR